MPRAAGALAVLAAAIVLASYAAPEQGGADVTSPNHLRQIEVEPGIGGTTAFYLHDAGYRLPHHRLLVALVSRAGRWSVTWAGPDEVTISLSPGWNGWVAKTLGGVRVSVTPPA